MKKFLIGLIVGCVLSVPTAVLAGSMWYSDSEPPTANTFLAIPYNPNTVSVFDDQDNKCYVVRGGYPNGAEARTVDISCVKKSD